MYKTAILLALLAVAASQNQAFAGPAIASYINQNYGFAIAVPSGLAIATDPPPAPQHGFQIILGQGRDISVDASFDSMFLGSAESAMQDRAADDSISGRIKPLKRSLAGLDAERIQAAVSGQRIDLAVAYRPNGNDVAIIYTFELDTDATHQAQDEPVFDEILKSFLLRTLPK